MKIDGKGIAQELLVDLTKKVAAFKAKGITPQLVIVLVGDDPASKAYVRQKELKGTEIGAKVTIMHFDDITQEKLLEVVKELNEDKNVHGIIIQQPLPTTIDIPTITQAVDPRKDVDSFHKESSYPMPLAAGVLRILESVYQTKTAQVESTFQDWLGGQTIVVIGKGETGGGPVIKALLAMHVTPKVVDSKTANPEELTKSADIIITAVGKTGVVNPSTIKKGVVLISVGLHKGEDGKLHGDYNEGEIADIASAYTPTPGGVGPVNVAMLLQNLLDATELLC